jgi:hypothetical protein
MVRKRRNNIEVLTFSSLVRGSVIGDENERGISGGERRRGTAPLTSLTLPLTCTSKHWC